MRLGLATPSIGVSQRRAGLPNMDEVLFYGKMVNGVVTDNVGESVIVNLAFGSVKPRPRLIRPVYAIPASTAGQPATYTIGPGQKYETFAALIAAVTIQPGDIIDGGGNTFTESWDIPNISGQVGNRITYRNATIDLSGDISGSCLDLQILTVNYLHFEDFWLIGSGDGACMVVSSTAGTGGAGYTITGRNINVLSNHGAGQANNCDGFSLSDTAQVLLYQCSAKECRPDPQSSGSEQAVTAHVAAKIICIDCTFDDSNHCYIGTADTYAYFYDCILRGSYTSCIGKAGDGAGEVIVDTCTVDVTNGSNLLENSDTTGNSIVRFHNCTINISGAGATEYISGKVQFYNNIINCNAPNQRIYAHNANATFEIVKNRINIQDCNFYLFQAYVSGSSISARENIITTAGSGERFLYGKAGPIEFYDNIVFDSVGTIIRIDVASGSVPIQRNIFYNSPAQLIDNNMADSSGLDIRYNVFHSCPDVIDTNGAGTVDYNCYYNSENRGGANSITSDPLLTDPGNGYYSISQASPLVSAGIAVAVDNRVDIVSGTSPADWVVSMPSYLALLFVLGNDNDLYWADNTPKQIPWATLRAAADDQHFFVGDKPAVVVYETNMSGLAAKINKYIGNA